METTEKVTLGTRGAKFVCLFKSCKVSGWPVKNIFAMLILWPTAQSKGQTRLVWLIWSR